MIYFDEVNKSFMSRKLGLSLVKFLCGSVAAFVHFCTLQKEFKLKFSWAWKLIPSTLKSPKSSAARAQRSKLD